MKPPKVSEVLAKARDRAEEQSEKALDDLRDILESRAAGQFAGNPIQQSEADAELVSCLREAADSFELCSALFSIVDSLFEVPVECPSCGNKFYPRQKPYEDDARIAKAKSAKVDIRA